MSDVRSSAAAVIALVGLGCGLVAPPARAEQPGAETPQALVERMKSAAERDDLAGIVACLAPPARAEMAMGLYMAATMVVAFSQMGLDMSVSMAEGMADAMGAEPTAEQQAEAAAQKEKARAELGKIRASYNALMAKYELPALPAEGEPEPTGPTPEEMKKKFETMDQGVFMTDVMAFVDSIPGTEEEEKSDEPEGPVKIGAGELTGLAIDGDHATGTLDGDPVTFVRLDGRWYFEALEQDAPATEPTEPADPSTPTP